MPVDAVADIAGAATFLGLVAALAGYRDFRRALYGGELACSRAPGHTGGCKNVYLLPEAWIRGRIHLSQAAPWYFAGLTILWLLWILLGEPLPFATASVVGALSVPYLIYLELFKARSLCLWCTMMHAALIVSAAAAILGLTRLFLAL